MSNNLSIWHQVDKTMPGDTKKVEFGRKFTAIDAHTQIMKATEVFGPCGIGWGIRNSKYTVLTPNPNDPNYNLLEFTGELWFKQDGQEGCFDIAADIELFEYVKKRAEWVRVEDSHKKVRTDALTKGLSWLGFNADVFLGLYDDNKYVQKMQQEERARQQEASKPTSPPPSPKPISSAQQQEQAFQRPAQASPASSNNAAPHELATEAQLTEIQDLAARNNLAGADFASWLRGSYNTTWSRLTVKKAADVIKGLNQLLKPIDNAALTAEFERDRQAQMV